MEKTIDSSCNSVASSNGVEEVAAIKTLTLDDSHVNQLSSPKVEASFRCCKYFAISQNFLKISKVQIWTYARVRSRSPDTSTGDHMTSPTDASYHPQTSVFIYCSL